MAHSLRFLVFITLSNKPLMEALKTFENLSETEKLQFFEVLVLNDGATPESNKSPGCSSHKLSLNFLLENLKNAPKKIDAENAHSDGHSNVKEPSKKQKTLDGWLLKSGDASICKKNELSPILQRSDVNVNSVQVSKACNSSQLPTNTYSTSSLLSPSHGCSGSAEDLNLSDDRLEKSTGSKENSLEISPNVNENKNVCVESSYNLRRRKNSSNLTPIDAHDSTSCNLITEQLEGASEYVQLAKTIEDQLHSSNMNILHGNKTSYNLRTKKKKSRKLQEWLQLTRRSSASSSTSRQDTISNAVDHPAPEDHAHNLEQSSFNHEAFSILSKTCNQFGLNIYNILQQEEIQNLLKEEEDPLNNSVFLIGAHKSATGQILPIVHMHESKTKLMQSLSKVQNFH